MGSSLSGGRDGARAKSFGVVFYGHPSWFMGIPPDVLITLVCQQKRVPEHLVRSINIGGFTSINNFKDVNKRAFDGFAARKLSEVDMSIYADNKSPCVTVAVISMRIGSCQAQGMEDCFYPTSYGEMHFDSESGDIAERVFVQGVYDFPELQSMNEAESVDWAADQVAASVQAAICGQFATAAPGFEHFTIDDSGDEEYAFPLPWMIDKSRLEFIGRVCAKINNVSLPVDLSSGYLYALPVGHELKH